MISSQQSHAEIVGVFDSGEAVEKAVSELTSAGWDRAALSLLGGKDLLSHTLSPDPTDATLSAAEPRSAPVVKDDVRQLRTLTAGLAGTVAAFLAAGATIMSGGATLVAVIGAAVTGSGAVALVEAMGQNVDQHRDDLLQQQLARGGILLWVAIRKLGDEEKARQILEKAGATDVRVVSGDGARDALATARQSRPAASS